jgi:hypothetical protein
LARLYVYGPTVAGIGGWQGKTPENICSHLSPSPQDFWLRNMDECHRLITQQFYSWVVLLEVILYFMILYKFSKWTFRSVFNIFRPTHNREKEMKKKIK